MIEDPPIQFLYRLKAKQSFARQTYKQRQSKSRPQKTTSSRHRLCHEAVVDKQPSQTLSQGCCRQAVVTDSVTRLLLTSSRHRLCHKAVFDKQSSQTLSQGCSRHADSVAVTRLFQLLCCPNLWPLMQRWLV